MPLSSCDENRLELAREAQAQFATARKLAQAGDNAAALEAFLFAFDNSLAVDGWGGVRLSYIPGAIAELGKKYPPALVALLSRRDAREQLIRDGETDYDVVAEWLSLNQYLNDKDREFTLLEELETAGRLDASLKRKIIEDNFERLLGEKKYKFLEPYFDRFGRNFIFKIFHFEEDSLLPRPVKGFEGDSMEEYWKARIILDGAAVYELAIGIKKLQVADEIAKRILSHCDPLMSYAALINAAAGAENKKKIRELKAQAKSALTKGDYEKLSG